MAHLDVIPLKCISCNAACKIARRKGDDVISSRCSSIFGKGHGFQGRLAARADDNWDMFEPKIVQDFSCGASQL